MVLKRKSPLVYCKIHPTTTDRKRKIICIRPQGKIVSKRKRKSKVSSVLEINKAINRIKQKVRSYKLNEKFTSRRKSLRSFTKILSQKRRKQPILLIKMNRKMRPELRTHEEMNYKSKGRKRSTKTKTK